MQDHGFRRSRMVPADHGRMAGLVSFYPRDVLSAHGD